MAVPHDTKFTLVILVWDEIEALKKIWNSLPLESAGEVIFIDPGSTDGTLEFIRSKGYEPVIQKAPGRGHAFVEALERARYEHVIFFSGDGNEDPRHVPLMASYLDAGYDLVIACRHMLPGAGRDNSDDPLLLRKYVTMIFALLVHCVWRAGVRDPLNGMRGMTRAAARRMKLDASGMDIEMQSTIRAAKLGLKIMEFPTVELPRAGGRRKKAADSLRIGYRHCVCLLRELWLGSRF